MTSCVIEADPVSYSERKEEDERKRTEAAEAKQLQVERIVLEAIKDHSLSNVSAIRLYTGKKQDAVSAAVGQLLGRGLIKAGKRGEPYTLQAAGFEELK